MNNLTSGLQAKGCQSRIHGSQDVITVASPTILIVPLHYDFEGNSKQRCIAMVKDILLNVYGFYSSAIKGDEHKFKVLLCKLRKKSKLKQYRNEKQGKYKQTT